MKKLMIVLMGCLAMATAWGKSFSIDLRQPVARNGVRAMANVKATDASSENANFLRRVNLDAGVADVGTVAVGDELTFTLFDDVTITLTLKKQMPSPLGGDVYLAEASGYEGIRNAVVVRTKDGLTVDIQDYRNKKVYKVISMAEGVSVQEMEAKGGRCGCDACGQPHRTGSALAKPQKMKRVAANKGAESDETCVDILVAYDKNAAAWASANGGGVTNFAQMAVQKMNTVLANNGLDWYFRFRLVGVMSVAASSDDLDFTLDSVTDGIGDWAPIKSARDAVGADIVTVLIDTGTDEGTTGLGWSLESDNFEILSECAYNCCAIRSVAQSHTMTHEVGHNMGAGHSDEQKTQPGPQLYSYSAGYYFTAGGERYHTVMAYDGEGPGGIEVPYFSSQIHFYKDVVVGDEYHDNRFTLQNTYMAVSQWRDDKGIEMGGDDDVPVEPLEWLTSRSEVFAKAKAEGKDVFLICGRDTCLNTMGTRNYSCEDPSVKRHLLQNYVCWYNVVDTQYEEVAKYFDGYDVGMTLPFIAVIDSEKDETLAAEGGYHTVNDLRVMLGRAAKDISFSPESGFRFRDSVEVALSAVPGAAIYYTLDGSDPLAGSSICYDKPIVLTETTTIRAITFVDGAWGLPIIADFVKSRTEKSGGYEWTADVVDGGCVIVSVTPEPTGAISIPSRIEGLDVIGFKGGLFTENANLTSVAISDGILEIPDSAFELCENLRAVSIGNGVESIGSYAFGWTGLKALEIPANVTNIGVRAFTGCYDMTAITVDSENKCYSSRDGFVYDKSLSHLIYCPGALRYVEIPQGVTHIGAGAFSDSNVERVVIPKSVEEMGDSAFVWCAQLKEIAIPESVMSVGYSAFDYCWAPLADVYLPKSLESDYIKDDSFFVGLAGVEVALHYYSGALQQFAVHFDANGGELETPDQTLEIVGSKIVVPSALPEPTSKGSHTFKGWFTAASGGTQLTADTVVTGIDTYYAQWTGMQKYTVTFDAGGGVGGKIMTQDYGTALTAPTVTRDGYTFTGWSPSVPSTVPAANVTYTAQWKVNQYTVTFNENGGAGGKIVTQDYGTALTAPTVTRDGYTFAGWSPSVPSTVPAANVTYTAQWTKISGGETPGPVTPDPVTPDPDPVTPDPEPVTPVDPTSPSEVYGGTIQDIAFAKAQTVDGVLNDADGNFAGTVQLRAGKINKKKGTVSISGSATLMNGKKITGKAVTVKLGDDGTLSGMVKFKAPIGDMQFEMEADGTFTFDGDNGYSMTEGAVGGNLPNGTVAFMVDIDSFPGLPAGYDLLEDALPFEMLGKVSGGKKIDFGKAASVKYKKFKDGKETWYELDGLDDEKKPNVPALKLTYTPKTGVFKGSFKIYATNEGSIAEGKKPTLKTYTVNVTGFFVGGVGGCQATLKKPAASWPVALEFE